jgi:hypothetical protein
MRRSRWMRMQLVHARLGLLRKDHRRHRMPPKRLDRDARPDRRATIRRRYRLPPKRLGLDRSPMRRSRWMRMQLVHARLGLLRKDHRRHRMPPKRLDRGRDAVRRLRWKRAQRVNGRPDRRATNRWRHRIPHPVPPIKRHRPATPRPDLGRGEGPAAEETCIAGRQGVGHGPVGPQVLVGRGSGRIKGARITGIEPVESVAGGPHSIQHVLGAIELLVAVRGHAQGNGELAVAACELVPTGRSLPRRPRRRCRSRCPRARVGGVRGRRRLARPDDDVEGLGDVELVPTGRSRPRRPQIGRAHVRTPDTPPYQ